MQAIRVAHNDRSEEPEAVHIRVTPREREILCALRAIQFGELTVYKREGVLERITTSVTHKLGQPVA